jgi:hypothetical protein
MVTLGKRLLSFSLSEAIIVALPAPAEGFEIVAADDPKNGLIPEIRKKSSALYAGFRQHLSLFLE